MDAKNKPNMNPKKGQDIEDLYQMLVYCKYLQDKTTKKHLQATKVILPFPESETPFEEEHSFEPIDGESISIHVKSIKLTTNELAKSTHDFLSYLQDKFDIDFKSTDVDKCSCQIAKYHEKQKHSRSQPHTKTILKTQLL